MQLKPVIQGLAVVWLMLFVASFVTLQTTEAEGGAQGGHARGGLIDTSRGSRSTPA